MARLDPHSYADSEQPQTERIELELRVDFRTRILSGEVVLHFARPGSGSQGARVVVLSGPVLPKGERTFSRNFRTDVFRVPTRGTIGNSAPTIIRGPGIDNWDIAIFKDFPLRDRTKFQFRWELYNAFNHTQFNGLDTGARFDPQGNQVNTRFGEFTSARSPRVMQFALRFTF